MHTDYERYRKMASLAQVGWWEADLTGGYYLCSDFLCDLLDLDGDTISFSDFLNLVREDYRCQMHMSSGQIVLSIRIFTNRPFPSIRNMAKSGCIPVWLPVRKERGLMGETNLLE